jgi:hypothetical protein
MTTPSGAHTRKVFVAAPVALAALVSCSSDETAPAEDSSGLAGTVENPVVLLAERVENPDSRQIYVSLLPDLPAAPIDRSKAYEFGNVDLSTANGKIYVFDRTGVTMTRYRASDGYELVPDTLADGSPATLGFQQIGLPGFGFENLFLSPERAYLIDWGEYRIVVWNPETMELETTIALDVALKEGYALSDSYLVSANVVDGKVFIGVYVWQTYANFSAHPGAGVIVVDPNAASPEPRLIEDDRMMGASKLFPTQDNRVLVVGDQYSGLYNSFGEAPDENPPAGVLRISPAGRELSALAFDDDYFVNLEEVTGSPGIYASYLIDSTNVLLQAWDPESPVNVETADEYWYAPEYVYLLVDLEAKTSRRVEELPKASAGSVEQFLFDGRLYVQTYETREEDVGRGAIVHRVSPQGIEEAFRIDGGDLWALKRVR